MISLMNICCLAAYVTAIVVLVRIIRQIVIDYKDAYRCFREYQKEKKEEERK